MLRTRGQAAQVVRMTLLNDVGCPSMNNFLSLGCTWTGFKRHNELTVELAADNDDFKCKVLDRHGVGKQPVTDLACCVTR